MQNLEEHLASHQHFFYTFLEYFSSQNDIFLLECTHKSAYKSASVILFYNVSLLTVIVVSKLLN